MKKIFSLVLCAMLAVASYAQDTERGFFVEPMAGMNLSKVSGGGLTTKFKFGFTGGVELGYQFNKHIGLSLDALYAMEGAIGADDSLLPGSKWKTNYLNVPVLFNYTIFDGFAIKAGIQPGFMLGSKLEYEAQSIKVTDMTSVDFAIPVGISYEFSNIVIDARYNIGLNEVENNTSMKNNVIQLTLGYKFHF